MWKMKIVAFLDPLTLNSTKATFQDLVLFLADRRNSNPFLRTDERFPAPTSNVKFCFDQGYELLEHLKCSKCCMHVSFQKLSRPGLWLGVRTVGTLQPAELSQEAATWHKWLPYIKHCTIYAGVFRWCFMIVWEFPSFPGFLWCLLIVYLACYASGESSRENIPLMKCPYHRLKFTVDDFFFSFNKKP